MLNERLSRAYDYVSDVIYRERLKLDFARKAKERAIQGPWLKDIHIMELEELVDQYKAHYGTRPNYQERLARVFPPAIDHYWHVLIKASGLR